MSESRSPVACFLLTGNRGGTSPSVKMYCNHYGCAEVGISDLGAVVGVGLDNLVAAEVGEAVLDMKEGVVPALWEEVGEVEVDMMVEALLVLWVEVLLLEEEALAVWHKLETMEVVIVKVMVKMVT